MNIQWLREYLTLCKTLNFRSASEVLFISQSSLSKHIAALECEFGTLLFDRDSKSVRLTHEGRIFRGSATKILEEYDSVCMLLSGTPIVKGNLRIAGGIRFPKINEILNPTIARFEELYPDVNIYPEDIQWQDYRESLIKGEFDIAFGLRLPNVNEEGLEFFDLFEVPLCIWTKGGGGFEGRDSISLKELDGWRLRILEEKKCQDYMSYLRGYFVRHGERVHLGKPLTQSFGFSDKEFGITPKFFPHEYFGLGTEVLEIEETENVTFSIINKSDATNSLVRLFLKEIKSFVEKQPVLDSVH